MITIWMSGGTVGHRVSNLAEWKGNCQPRNREWSGWIDSQAVKSIYSFVVSLLALKTYSMGHIWLNLKQDPLYPQLILL